MALITKSVSLDRIQVLNCEAADPTIERFVNVQTLVDGEPVGEPKKTVMIAARPASSFSPGLVAALAELSDVSTSDIE